MQRLKEKESKRREEDQKVSAIEGPLMNEPCLGSVERRNDYRVRRTFKKCLVAGSVDDAVTLVSWNDVIRPLWSNVLHIPSRRPYKGNSPQT